MAFIAECIATTGKKAEPESGGELHVLIKEAKNLVGVKLGAMVDTFVKGFVPVRLAISPHPRCCELTEAVFVDWQLLVPDRRKEHEEEDQAGEEEPQPSLRLHICL